MPYSALALGHDGLRLRSRRVRSDRSQRPSVRLVVAFVVVAGLVGTGGGSLGLDIPAVHVPGWMPAPSVPTLLSADDLPTRPEDLVRQRYLADLLPIHVRVEQSVVQMGLLAAVYESQEIDRGELRRRLGDDLTNYHRAEEQIGALRPPADLQGMHDRYLGAVSLFRQSAVELLQMVDDGNEDHFRRAMPLTLEGASRLRTLADRFWPAESRAARAA
jgi:hypothetical protein